MTLDITHKKWVQMTHGTRGGCRIFPHRTIGAFFADWGDGVLPIKKGGAIVMGDPKLAGWFMENPMMTGVAPFLETSK